MGPLDQFVDEAAKQYRDGHIDQQLWTHSARASEGRQVDGIANYLRERAESLRRIDRELQLKARARAARIVENPSTMTSRQGGLWPSKNDGRRRGIRQSRLLRPGRCRGRARVHRRRRVAD